MRIDGVAARARRPGGLVGHRQLRRVRPLHAGHPAAVPIAREVRTRARAPRVGAVGRIRHPRAAARRHDIVRVGEDVPSRVAAPASCATATAVAALDAASARVDLDGALVLVTGGGTDRADRRGDGRRGRRRGDRRPIRMPRGARSRAGSAPCAVDPRAAVDVARAARHDARRVRGPRTARGARGRRDLGRAVGRAHRHRDRSASAASGCSWAAWRRDPRCASTPSRSCADSRRSRPCTTTRGAQLRARGRVPRARRGGAVPFDELVGATHPLAELDDALAEAATGRYVRVGVAPGRRPA